MLIGPAAIMNPAQVQRQQTSSHVEHLWIFQLYTSYVTSTTPFQENMEYNYAKACAAHSDVLAIENARRHECDVFICTITYILCTYFSSKLTYIHILLSPTVSNAIGSPCGLCFACVIEFDGFCESVCL